MTTSHDTHGASRSPRRHAQLRRAATILIALVGAATVLAGCGHGRVYVKHITSTTEGKRSLPPADQTKVLSLARKYAHCMQQNGAPSFPDPTVEANGKVSIRLDGTGTRSDTTTARHQNADRACRDLRHQLPQSLSAQLP